ncbi:MAG: TonB-dependent receptor [Mariniphaga sp.]|nr:TonB-dependent receptor [Mariniphaga sp.]
MRRFSIWLLLQLMVVAALGQYNLKGIVTGEGEPLPGASILLKNTFYGLSTNHDGEFEFRNLKNGTYVLQVSFLGYEDQQVLVRVPDEPEVAVDLVSSTFLTGEVLISATRAKEKTPVAFTNLSREEISSGNMGQDIPYLLQLTPSFVATSDAGAGVGYTNFRIRGTDLTRINVTVNGIPLNDPESHGTWFVDQPDLATSLDNVQIQRGVGTSANGAAAFGATINLQTNTLNKEPYAAYHSAAGSFQTFKNSISAGTGLIQDKFSFDARLSKINSDGFVDRAASDLKSFFVSGGLFQEKTIIKATLFSGVETTYQSWNGVPSVRLNNDLEGMKLYGDHGLYTPKQTEELFQSNPRTYNLYTYENQVDFYQQDHYQLHFSHKFNPALNINTSLFLIRGKGYYENFKEDEDMEDYQIPIVHVGSETVESTDLVNQKWLDNYFYGLTFSLNYQKRNSEFILGGGWNAYDGDHFGKVIWGRFLGDVHMNHDWYRNNALKRDFNLFGKYNYQLLENLNLFADLQYRGIDYQLEGIDDDLRDISRKLDFHFFNPKLGVSWEPNSLQKLYLSWATANREPNRSAFIDANPAGKQPVYETLFDYEAGYEFRSSGFSGNVNFYFMNYKDQLVLTGEINDVGNPIMANVDKSYRAGVELQVGIPLSRNLFWMGNATFSKNKIKNFVEFVENWDTGEQEAFELGTTNIAFSPNRIANSQLKFEPVKNLNLEIVSSYVGKQFIDNTSNNNRSLDAWLVNNLKANYSFKTSFLKEVVLQIMVNNIFNEDYESNAWVYSYIYNNQRYKMDGYFPQAGRHFMAGINLRF